MRKKRTLSSNLEQGILVMAFFNNAYADYIAARKLLINNLLIQGTILANTAIEKYFKAMKAMLNEEIPRHHDITVKKFQNSVKNKFPELHNKINFEFLKYLTKTYLLRYVDEVHLGFSIVISKRKTLAELDYMVNLLEKSFEIRLPFSENNQRRYDVDLQSSNIDLFEMNYILNKEIKKDFIEKLDEIYQFTKTENGFFIEYRYQTNESKDDGKFC